MSHTMLVTGGAGFIGSNFLCYMVQKYPLDTFVCFDALTYASNMQALSPVIERTNFVFIKGDISDPDAVEKAFFNHRPDCVINFAAESHVDRSIEDPSVFLKTNVIGTSVIMDACLKYGVKRFHQVSTDEVYGDLPLDVPSPSFTEESPLRPSSSYAASKASADLLVSAYVRTYGLNATITRSTNNFGPWQHPEKLIPLMVSRAVFDQPLPVYGNGLNERDWIYVLDHVKAIERVLTNGKAGEIYNVGADCPVKNIDIVNRILSILGKNPSLIAYVPDRKGHDLKYSIDSEKIRKELLWKPEHPFESEFEKTIFFYRDYFLKRNT